MTYEEILNKLKDVNTPPGELSQMRMWLGAEYGFRSDELGSILALKAPRLLETREKVKTDKLAEWTWNASPEGISELQLRLRLKGLEKVLSSINTRLRTLENESKNQY